MVFQYSWLTTLFNMDGSMDSTEIAFLWLVIFGVLVGRYFAARSEGRLDDGIEPSYLLPSAPPAKTA